MEPIAATPTYWDMGAVEQTRSLQAASQGLESLFAHMMLSEARKSMPEGFLGSSNASKMFYDMFDMQIAQEIAASGALSFGDTIEAAVRNYTQNGDEGAQGPVKG